jgi:O-antigen/teichoic acid export membrane protein
MSGLRRIVNNTLISLFGQFVTWTSTLGLTIAYGRFLGDVKFGELYFAISFVSLIGFPVEFGFNQQLTRDIAAEPQKAQAYLWNTLLIKMILWISAYGCMLLIVRALGYSQEEWTLVAIAGVSLLSGSVVNTFAALHYAFEHTVFPSVGMMLEKGLSACVGFLLLKNGATVQTMAVVLLGGSVLDAIWVACWFFRLVGIRVTFEKATLLKLLRTSIPFVVYGVLGVIYYRIDTVLLSLMTGTAVVGWYGAGYRLFDTLLFIPNLILNAVMYPVFSRLSGTSQPALRTAVEKCMNLLLICAIPMAAFLFITAPAIIGFLYHRPDFINAVPVVQALAPGLVFLYINTLFSSIIVSTKGEKKIPIMAAAALIFNLGLNLFLIPRYQQVGAAVVTSLTELLLLCISLAFVPTYLLPKKSLKVAAKTLLASLCMAGTLFFLQTFSLFVLLPVAFLIYISMATLFRTIPREDVQSLYQAVKRRGTKAATGTLEILTEVADENIYLQVTDPHLPVVTLRKPLSERKKTIDLQEDKDATEILPALHVSKTLFSTTTDEEDEDATEILPALHTRKKRTQGQLQLEGLE